MATKTITRRLKIEGAAEIRGELEKVAKSGRAAFAEFNSKRGATEARQQASALRDLSGAAESTVSPLTRASGAVALFAKNLGLIGGAVVSAVGVLGTLAKTVAGTIQQQKNAADNLGLTIDQYRRFELVGKVFGASAEDVNGALTTIQQSIGRLTDSSSQQINGFVKDSSGGFKTVEAQMKSLGRTVGDFFQVVLNGRKLGGVIASTPEEAQRLARLEAQAKATAEGLSEADQALYELRISLTKDGKPRDAIEIFKEISDRLVEYKSTVDQARLAQMLFGPSYKQLLPILRQGSKEIQAINDIAARATLGKNITDEAAKQAQLLQKQTALISFTLEQRQIVLRAKLLKFFTAPIQAIIDAWVGAEKTISKVLGHTTIEESISQFSMNADTMEGAVGEFKEPIVNFLYFLKEFRDGFSAIFAKIGKSISEFASSISASALNSAIQGAREALKTFFDLFKDRPVFFSARIIVLADLTRMLLVMVGALKSTRLAWLNFIGTFAGQYLVLDAVVKLLAHLGVTFGTVKSAINNIVIKPFVGALSDLRDVLSSKVFAEFASYAVSIALFGTGILQLTGKIKGFLPTWLTFLGSWAALQPATFFTFDRLFGENLDGEIDNAKKTLEKASSDVPIIIRRGGQKQAQAIEETAGKYKIAFAALKQQVQLSYREIGETTQDAASDIFKDTDVGPIRTVFRDFLLFVSENVRDFNAYLKGVGRSFNQFFVDLFRALNFRFRDGGLVFIDTDAVSEGNKWIVRLRDNIVDLGQRARVAYDTYIEPAIDGLQNLAKSAVDAINEFLGTNFKTTDFLLLVAVLRLAGAFTLFSTAAKAAFGSTKQLYYGFSGLLAVVSVIASTAFEAPRQAIKEFIDEIAGPWTRSVLEFTGLIQKASLDISKPFEDITDAIGESFKGGTSAAEQDLGRLKSFSLGAFTEIKEGAIKVDEAMRKATRARTIRFPTDEVTSGIADAMDRQTSRIGVLRTAWKDLGEYIRDALTKFVFPVLRGLAFTLRLITNLLNNIFGTSFRPEQTAILLTVFTLLKGFTLLRGAMLGVQIALSIVTAALLALSAVTAILLHTLQILIALWPIFVFLMRRVVWPVLVLTVEAIAKVSAALVALAFKAMPAIIAAMKTFAAVIVSTVARAIVVLNAALLAALSRFGPVIYANLIAPMLVFARTVTAQVATVLAAFFATAVAQATRLGAIITGVVVAAFLRLSAVLSGQLVKALLAAAAAAAPLVLEFLAVAGIPLLLATALTAIYLFRDDLIKALKNGGLDIEKIFGGIKNALKGDFTEIKQFAGNIWQSLPEGVQKYGRLMLGEIDGIDTALDQKGKKLQNTAGRYQIKFPAPVIEKSSLETEQQKIEVKPVIDQKPVEGFFENLKGRFTNSVTFISDLITAIFNPGSTVGVTKSLEEAQRQVDKLQKGDGSKTFERIKGWSQEVDQVVTSAKIGAEELGEAFKDALPANPEAFEEFIQTTEEAIDRVRVLFVEVMPSFVDQGFTAVLDIVSSLASNIRSEVDDIIAAVQRAKDAVASLPSGSGDGGAPFAAGGYVSGPGTGTSDSIRAWLSNGEFVINARAVRRLGLDLLRRLNSGRVRSRDFPIPRFAMGGLVGPSTLPIPSFTPGGPSLPGKSFDLVIDTHRFSGLYTPEATAENLFKFAQSAKVRSAGRAPGWKK